MPNQGTDHMLPTRIRTKILVVFYIISAIPLIGYLFLYFQFKDQNELLDQLIEKQHPISLLWVQLKSGMNQSLAAQRGWVLFGDESFKEERVDAWKNEIGPILEELRALYRTDYQVEHPQEVRLFYDLRLIMNDLREVQESIEAIAHTPSNIPARQLYLNQIKPALNTMNNNLLSIAAQESLETLESQKVVRILSEWRGSLRSTAGILQTYVLEGEKSTWELFQQGWNDDQRLFLDIQSLNVNFNEIQESHLRQLLASRKDLTALSESLYQARLQKNWNIALDEMVNVAIPKMKKIEEAINTILNLHAESAKTSNRTLQEEFERWRVWLLLVPLGIFLTGFILSMFLGRRVVVPLQELRDAVRYVKNEDFYGHIEVTTQDEVGELAQEFEEMLAAIRERTIDANRGRQILENSPFPVMLATPDRELEYLNPAALRELKRLIDFLPAKPEEMLGKGIDFLLESTSIEVRQLSTPFNLPPSTDISIGDQIIEVTFSPLFDANNLYLGPVLHWKNATQDRLNQKARLELVSRLEAEGRSQQLFMEQLEEQNRTLRDQVELDSAQSVIAKAINSLDVGSILEAALETFVKTTYSQLGILYLHDNETEQLELKHHYSVDDTVMQDEFYQVHGLPTHIFSTQEASVIRNPSAERGQSFHLGGIANYPAVIAGYPLVFQQQCLGVLLLSSVAPFSESIMRFVENAVPQLAVSIQNAMTFQTVQTQQEILQVANLELEAATRIKSEFLASMSHELRTPLNAIIGFAEALLDVDEDNPLTDYQGDRLQRVHKSGKHLLELINSILDLSKIEAKKMQVNVMKFNLRELLDDVLGLMESLVANKPIELELRMETNLEEYQSDQDKIRQITINLLGNAIKFTEQGSITVTVTTVEESVEIAVQDTGCGIPQSQLQTIFESFRQVDGSETRHYEGSGLGLALVQSMSRLLGGDVSVSSIENEGSTFTVALPLRLEHKTSNS